MRTKQEIMQSLRVGLGLERLFHGSFYYQHLY